MLVQDPLCRGSWAKCAAQVPPLLWMAVRGGAWLSTVAIALGVWLTSAVESLASAVVSQW